MRFVRHKRRQPPSIIIVSLIDILIVLLIFLTVTTTFQQYPSIEFSLPESKQPKKGTSEANLVITIAKEKPHFYLGSRPVTYEKLHTELESATQANPDFMVSVRADANAPFKEIVRVMDTVRELQIGPVNIFTEEAISP